MDTKALDTANTDKDKVVEIAPELKVSQYIPDCIQKTVMEALDNIEIEIRQHEDAIKELEKLYSAHAHFLEHYSPFGPDGDLSQTELTIEQLSPEAMPQAERGTDE